MAGMDFWQPASFRGVPFFVDAYAGDGGRRGPDHEFPGKDEGYPEDTGKRIERIALEAYVVRTAGDPGYAERAEALRAALNQYGPGELVHPVFGTIRVQVRSWRLSENKNRLGVIPFSLTFTEAGQARYPSAAASAAAGVPGAASSAHKAAADAFAGSFQLSGLSDFLTASALAVVERLGDAYSLAAILSGGSVNVQALLSAASAGLASAAMSKGTDEFAEALAAFPRSVTVPFEEKHRRTRNADGTYRALSTLRGNGPLEEEAVTALDRILGFGSGLEEPQKQTASRLREYQNAEAIAEYARRTAAIEAARIAPFVNWRTLDAAEEARDRIAGSLEAAAWNTASDSLHQALTGLRLLLLRTVAPDTGRLPRLLEYRMGSTAPSLVLSHRLYGTAGKAAELAELNGIRHPGFMPGGETIRILANA